MNYLDDKILSAMNRSMRKSAFVPMPGGMPGDQGMPPGGAPPAPGGAPMPPQGGAPMPPGPGGMPPQGGGGMPVPPEIIPILQQLGITVDQMTGMAIDPGTGQPIPTEMLMQILQEQGLLGGAPGGMPPGGDPAAMGGAPPMDPSMAGGPPMDPGMAGGPPPEPPIPPDAAAMMSKEEFKAMIADSIKRDLPGILKQELPSIIQPMLKELASEICGSQYEGLDENIINQLAESVSANNEIMSRITGAVE